MTLRRTSAFAHSLLGLLLFALVAAQALGMMHRVAHAPVAGSGPVDFASHEAGTVETHHRAGWLAALFSGHGDDSSCRLFDPLSHEGAPVVPVVPLSAVFSSLFIGFFQGEFLARWAALFDARGPPSLR